MFSCEGEVVKVEVEDAKSGKKEELEADVLLLVEDHTPLA